MLRFQKSSVILHSLIDSVPFLLCHGTLTEQIQVDGTPKSAEDVKAADLQVKVIDRIYHLPTAEHPLGRYEEPTLHTYITQGKDGGYSG